MLFTHVGYRGRYEFKVSCALKNSCCKTEKNNPHPIILLVLYLKVKSYAQSQWEILCCWHTKLPLGRFSIQTSYHRHHGNKVNKTASLGQRQEGVVFFGAWDKIMPGHPFWQVWEQPVEETRGNRGCCWVWSPDTSLASLQCLGSGCGSCRRFSSDVCPAAGVYIPSSLLFS